MVHALIVTHGSLGREFREIAFQMAGAQDGVDVLSNSDAAVDGLVSSVERWLAERSGPAFLFVDLFGGSCSFACETLRKKRPDTWLVTGVNLPMLVDFLHNRDRVPPPELAQRLLAKGRDGIQVR